MQKRTPDELGEALHHQFAALEASSNNYDSGNFWEALRLATTVTNLVNNGRSKTVSILSQLSMRDSIDFVTHAVVPHAHNLISNTPLCVMYIGFPSTGYRAVLDESDMHPRRVVPFAEWWNETVFRNSAGEEISRMNLVLALRSQDGGSHYDAELPVTPYLELKNDGLGFEFIGPDDMKIQPAHFATMRQIAYELEQSIKPHL